MQNRTVYILGCILGKMVKTLNVNSDTILLNAYHNPMREITTLHLNHIHEINKDLSLYIGTMLNQIDKSEDISADINPKQQNPLILGYYMGTMPFKINNEMSERRITQQALADRLGVNRVTVARWVKDGFPKDRLNEIELTIYSLSGIIGNGREYIN